MLKIGDTVRVKEVISDPPHDAPLEYVALIGKIGKLLGITHTETYSCEVKIGNETWAFRARELRKANVLND